MKEQALILREQAKSQLMEIKNVDEAVTYVNKIKAVETYCKAVKEDNEIVKLVAEQKIRSMRLAGEMLQETNLNQGATGNHSNQYQKEVRSSDVTAPTLSDLGLTKNESSTYQKLASIPIDRFEEEMTKAKDGDSTKDITVSRFKNLDNDNKISQKLSNEKQLKKYAKLLGYNVAHINPDLIVLHKRRLDLSNIKLMYNQN